ncbi:MAG: type II toxin-antitoxin system Phd/YefM family antitoxin [Gammaproteobacteria bacterium]
MKSLSVRETRSKLAQLETLVEQAGEIVITRRGKPIARLLPVVNAKAKPDHRALRERMPYLKTGSEALVSAERDER